MHIIVDLPETFLYKEIADHLINFIENYLTQEKIYQVYEKNNEINDMKNIIIQKSEEIEEIKKNNKLQEFLELEKKNKELQIKYEDLQKYSEKFKDKILKVKTELENLSDNDNENTENIVLENASLNIKFLELKEVTLIIISNFLKV